MIKKIILSVFLMCGIAHAQTVVLPSYQGSNSSPTVVSSSTPLPVTISGGISSGVNLGTSASVTNPQRSGDATTGLFSAASNTVSIAEGGTDVADFAAAGINIAMGSLKLAGNNGIIYPNSTSVVIGPTGGTALTGIQNTSVGDLALNAATTGTNDTAVGYNAGSGITTGIDNTCFGSGTNCGGTANDDVAIGFNAIASSSQATSVGSGARAENGDVAIGYHTLNGATTGSNSFDTAVGFEALQGNTTGIDNTAVGAIAGQGTVANTSGSQNVWVGYSAHSGAATDTNEIVIGYMGAGTGSNSTTIGTSNTTAAKIFGALSAGANAANFLLLSGAATTVAPTITNSGSDTNGVGLGLTITTKTATATGVGGPLKLNTGSGDNGIAGQITVQPGASAGTGNPNGANIVIEAGAPAGTGTPGYTVISDTAGPPATPPTFFDNQFALEIAGTDNSFQAVWTNTAGTHTGGLFVFGADPQAAVQIGSTTDDNFGIFTDSGSVQANFNINGGLSIGTTVNTTNPPANGLLVGGVVNLPSIASSASALDAVCWNASGGVLTHNSAGALCSASLEELKDKIASIFPFEALGEVMDLRPFWGKFKDTVKTTSDHQVHAMFGAHQVESVDKRLAEYDEQGKLYSVHYAEMTAVLVAAVQALQSQIFMMWAIIIILFYLLARKRKAK